jgi:hypothetical protein
MKNLLRMSLLAALMTGIGFAQQEVNPDHFDGDAAKQPVKVKHVARANQNATHLAQAKHHVSGKSGNKPVLSARNVAGN